MKKLVPASLALALALVLSPLVRAQDMGKKDDSDEAAKLAAELVKEAKRFTSAIKIQAKDAVAKATQKQPGIVTALKAEQDTTKDKDGKELKVDFFEVTVVSKLEEPPAPNAPKAPEPPKKDDPKKEAPSVFLVRVDAEGKVSVKPAVEEVAREATNEAKRLQAAKATVSIATVIDKISSHEKAVVISVVLEDREDRKDKKGEGYLVYALLGDGVAWYDVDAVTGEVEKKKL